MLEKRKPARGNKQLGKWGEDAARQYLEEQGIHILAANVRTQFGEIDLIGQHEGSLVFFEVKTRRTRTFGFPEESVTSKKQDHMRQSALDYLQSQDSLEADWRIDVIAIEKQPDKQVRITWFKHALSG